MTQRISAAVETFVPCHGWSNDRLATRIRDDKIDILIELSGHTSGHRLAMLRNRVAPIQMTYLGYPNTTGLSAMDWRITDELADPSGYSEVFYTEKLARIEGGFLAYSVNDFMKDLPVGALPAEKGKGFTFGSFNNLAKVNEDVLAAWIRILNRLPHASLIMKARGMHDKRVTERLFHIFRCAGIEESRIVLKGHELFMKEHLACYNEIDLALDTFPYAGTTTTCEALWMGVPVVTLAGDKHAGRVGVSLLTHIGLEECIGQTVDDYIENAVRLASNLPRLAALRKSMRKQMLVSPLMDYERMARGIEKIFQQAWIEHCRRNY
jgi:predicted O-linked N-acetylglucosamine transferase (SPINDLY family)